MNTLKILGEAVGIQSQGTIDKTEEQIAPSLVSALIIGQFKRGRIDKPMVIHQGNIRGQLGHDPQNHFYNAVQDCLDTGVPSVQVLRIGKVDDGNGGLDPTFSCEGAVNSAKFIFASTLTLPPGPGDLTIKIDGVKLEEGKEPPSWFEETPIGVEPPFQLPEGYRAVSYAEIVNLDETKSHRIEAISEIPELLVFILDNPTVIQLSPRSNRHVGVCLSPKQKNSISCVNAVPSIKWAYAVRNGTSSAIALKTYVDGVQRDIIGDPPNWLTKDILDEMPAGEVAEDFYTANGVYKFNNNDTVPHRLEFVILNPSLFRSVVSDNPTLIQMTDKFGEHVGVCLSPKQNPVISCDGATPQMSLADCRGTWDFYLNGEFKIRGLPGDISLWVLNNKGGELWADWDGPLVFNLLDLSKTFRFRMVPSESATYHPPTDIEDNPTFMELGDGDLIWCLADDSPQISCDGAVVGTRGAYLVPNDMTRDEFFAWYNQENPTTLKVNGVEMDYNDFLDILVETHQDENVVIPPDVIPDGYKLAFNIPWLWENKQNQNLRIEETVNGSDVVKIVYWDNPTALENHVCLAGKA
ncbi:hypothetical protein [Acinetobacter sp. TUM15113]|uniref:hypothetical protein n=1 Tax=Acinetobacter sp. TUM15113 TaxID=2609140 RepID=UPI001D18012B|nr:hypothetical protein [Acinetobacter sp. TUM15113]